MGHRRYALLLALCGCMPAVAQLSTLVESVEAAPAVLNLPTSPNGNLTFKPCANTCDAEYIVVRLTPVTQFVVMGKTVDFAEFRKLFYNRRRSNEGYALVTYDTSKNTATSVEVEF